MSDLPFGIDISKHQGVNDFAKMKANATFVFVKATESWGYTDPKFFANWQGLIGHNRGAYCYVWLSDDPLRQANHLIDIVTQAGVDWRYDRLVLDLEKSGHGLSRAEVTRRVLVMMERIKEVTGRYPILYSRKYWLQDNMLLTDPRLINADWWLAYYRTALPYPLYTPEMPSPPPLPIGVSKWLIHQTCEKGNGREVGVGSYYVDQNRFNGTKDQLDAYFGRGEIIPEPEPEPPVIPDPVEPEPEPTIPDGLLDVPHYSQTDPLWAQDIIGASNFNIGAKGCLLTITAAGLTFFGFNVNPMAYNCLATNKGGYLITTENGKKYANMYWQFPDVLTKGQIVRDEYQTFASGTGWEQSANAILAKGKPVWCEVRLNNYQHWVLILGKVDGAFWILDPIDGAVKPMDYPLVFRTVSYSKVGA